MFNNLLNKIKSNYFSNYVGFYPSPDNKTSSFNLIDKKMVIPILGKNDVLVKVKSSSINPIDVKTFRRSTKEKIFDNSFKVPGYGASGVIKKIGSNVSNFNIGDEVFYVGSQKKNGSFSEYELLDSSIISLKPTLFNYSEAASVSLSSLTSLEIIKDKLKLDLEFNKYKNKKMLIINGGGGTGITLSEISKYLGIDVFSAVGSYVSIRKIKEIGIKKILNYNNLPKYKDYFDYIIILHSPDDYIEYVGKSIKPFGKIVSVVENINNIDISAMKNKSADFMFEFVFTKTNYSINVPSQGNYLRIAAKLANDGYINSNIELILQGLNSENVNDSLSLVENRQVRGKIIIEH